VTRTVEVTGHRVMAASGKTDLERWIDVIEFESVSKTFRDGTTAVTDLDLTVPSHKITVIVGPSGCGKTTTLRMVNRMLEPSKGRITWDGTPMRSIRRTKLRRQMGYVIQSGGLFPHRTVLENIGTVPGLLRWDKTKIRKRSFELLASVGLDPKLADRYPAQLSGGQQQRVGVARALAADPLVLLMDEPFSAVDPVVRGELHEFFLELQRRLSKTIILITHDIDEAIKLGDQVAILRVGGRLAQLGTPQQLLDEPADAFVEGFVGKDRGYRSLSFVPAAGLPLDSVPVVRDMSAAEDEPSLVLDADARPLGWADRTHRTGLHPVGSTFDPETDTLRIALDAALTSPVGLAVAVNRDSGRFAGVVSAREILAQIADVKAAQQDSIVLANADSDQVMETHDQDTITQPSVGDEALGAIAGAEADVDNSDAAERHANDTSLAAPDVAGVSPEEHAAGADAGDRDVNDRDRDVSPGEYVAGSDTSDRDVDDRVEMSPPKEYTSSADTGDQDVDENGLQEHVDSTGDEDHDSDVISPEERDPNSEVLEAPEAADAASGAGERDGQAAGGSDGLEEAHADPNVVEKMEDEDRAEAQPDSEIGVETGATVSEEFTEQSEHSDDDTLLIPEVPVDIVPDALIDNGQHVRSAWHESDADRAEAPVR
jgi:osmoprotectant transport system ATP-binding protein